MPSAGSACASHAPCRARGAAGTLWLLFVAWPLWHAGTLAGSSAEEIAFAFAFVPVLAAVVPWGYVWREYVRVPRSAKQA